MRNLGTLDYQRLSNVVIGLNSTIVTSSEPGVQQLLQRAYRIICGEEYPEDDEVDALIRGLTSKCNKATKVVN